MDRAIATTWAPRALSLLRIVAGLLFLEHGLQKLPSFPTRLPVGAHLPTSARCCGSPA